MGATSDREWRRQHPTDVAAAGFFQGAAHEWLAARARNALRSRRTITIAAVATLIATLSALVVLDRVARLRSRDEIPRGAAKPDTMNLLAMRARLVDTASTIAQALANARFARERAARDSEATELVVRARRDTLAAEAAQLTRLLARAVDAPLPSSYRALAEAPWMRGQSRVRALADSLGELERARESFEAVAGVDPVFVALTERVTEIGHALQAIASARRNRLLRAASSLAPANGSAPTSRESLASSSGDSLTLLSRAEAVREQLGATEALLIRNRRADAEIDRRARATRLFGGRVASDLGVLSGSVLFALTCGFALALCVEIGRPVVADENEVQRVTGARADAISTLLNEPALGVLYQRFAPASAAATAIAIIAPPPGPAARLAIALAEHAAREGRHALVVDADPSVSGLARALDLTPEPGYGNVARGAMEFADVRAVVRRPGELRIDVIPSGRRVDGPPDAVQSVRFLADFRRLVLSYDLSLCIVPAWDDQPDAGVHQALEWPVLLCLERGRTPLRDLTRLAARLRALPVRIAGTALLG